MPLPPKGDPARPLHLAVRSTRILGIFPILFGMMVLVGVSLAYNSGANNAFLQLAVGLGLGLVFTCFGVALLIFAAAIRRHRLWALFATMALAGLALGVISIGLLQSAMTLATGNAPPSLFLMLTLQVVFAAAFSQLMYHLTKARTYVISSEHLIRGFQPLMPVMRESDRP